MKCGKFPRLLSCMTPQVGGSYTGAHSVFVGVCVPVYVCIFVCWRVVKTVTRKTESKHLSFIREQVPQVGILVVSSDSKM